MEEKQLVGVGYGRFQADNGKMLDYCNVFVLEDFAGQENDDYHFQGKKAVKYSCISPDVFAEIPMGTKVMCFFDSKRRVTYMVDAAKMNKGALGKVSA